MIGQFIYDLGGNTESVYVWCKTPITLRRLDLEIVRAGCDIPVAHCRINILEVLLNGAAADL